MFISFRVESKYKITINWYVQAYSSYKKEKKGEKGNEKRDKIVSECDGFCNTHSVLHNGSLVLYHGSILLSHSFLVLYHGSLVTSRFYITIS